jgi:hypothetical protein
MFDEDDLAYLDPMDEAFTKPGGHPHNDELDEQHASKKGSEGSSDGHVHDLLVDNRRRSSSQSSDPHKTM